MEEEGERKAARQQLHKPATANNEQRTPILIALECCCCVERMPFREYALRAGSSRCQGKCTASRFASLSNVPAQPNFCERQTPSHSPAPRYKLHPPSVTTSTTSTTAEHPAHPTCRPSSGQVRRCAEYRPRSLRNTCATPACTPAVTHNDLV
jgi:hypothetical protein